MNRMRVRLWLLVMLVLLAGPGLVHARPVSDGSSTVRGAEPSIFSEAWSWLVSIFGNGGSMVDPLGGPDVVTPGSNHLTAGGAVDPLAGAR